MSKDDPFVTFAACRLRDILSASDFVSPNNFMNFLDKTASTLPPVKLVDGEGREYDESSKRIFVEKSFGVLKSVNPGVTSRGYVIFDVPTGSYALKVSGGYTSGASAIIDLQ